MKRDTILTQPFGSTFLSCEKDAEAIIKKLFVSSQPYSNDLKRLMVINTKDCLDKSNQSYQKITESISVKDLIEGKYVSLVPKIKLKEHENVKSYLLISFDNFFETDNPEFRDCQICFDILCHTDYWELKDYQLRPFKIMGIIDGILNNSKLSGIGQLQFVGAKETVVSEDLSGYTMIFKAVHGSDDKVPGG